VRITLAYPGLRLLAAVAVACATSLAVAPEPAVAAAPAVADGAPSPDPGAAAVIARYQARIPQLMAEQEVPGLSVAVVDGHHVLWAEGFGYTDRDRKTPVGVDTIFSVQSMSKLFTSTAVMHAVQDGLVDLDVPITAYLPDFTVHSAFEEHPEEKITLRMLLSHTAGFTMEAPVGNNNLLDPGEFDDHVRSISDTWLRFPVGTGYAYSNLGIDLAGYTLEKVYGKPFAQVMENAVLAPLGMDHSTFDRARIRATSDRAIGQALPMANPPLDVAMAAAGGLYASVADLARFLEFQLGDGTIDGRTVLGTELIQEQRTVPAPNEGAPWGYALGVARTRWMLQGGSNPDLFSHGGGGYGFLADIFWLPQLQLGIALLTNSSSFQEQGDLALSILGDLVAQPGSDYLLRMVSLPYQSSVVEGDGHYLPPIQMDGYTAGVAMAPDAEQASRWARYEAAYRIAGWGVMSPTESPNRFLVEAGVPYFDSDEKGLVTRHRLAEYQPGLFVADNGEIVDFRGPQPTWRNLILTPVSDGPLSWQWALLALVAVVAIAWFAGGAIARVRRRRRPGAGPPSRRRSSLVMSVVASLAAILALVTIATIALIPGLVDAGFLGWLLLPTPVRLLLHVPLGLAILAVGMTVLAVAGWSRGWWPPESRVRYAALTVACCVLASQLAAWHLIGWGFG
jgi:CubicO group peptidase (beta-lactamase class C family)